MQDVEHKAWCLWFCSSVESGCMLITNYTYNSDVLREVLTMQLDFYLPLLLAVDAFMAQCTDLSPQDQKGLSITQIVLNKVNQASGNSWCGLIKRDKWTKKHACLQSGEERMKEIFLHVSARQHVRSHAAGPNEPASHHQHYIGDETIEIHTNFDKCHQQWRQKHRVLCACTCKLGLHL